MPCVFTLLCSACKMHSSFFFMMQIVYIYVYLARRFYSLCFEQLRRTFNRSKFLTLYEHHISSVIFSPKQLIYL